MDRHDGNEDAKRHAAAIATWEIGIYDHDHLTGDIYGCARTRELYGFGPDVPLTIEVFAAAVHPEDLSVVMAAVERSHRPESGGAFAASHRIVRADGEVRWIETRAQTSFHVVDGERRPRRTLGSIMDMTEMKLLQAQLSQAQKMEALGMLAGGIAHDFNNLLSVIVGSADLLSHKLGPDHFGQRDLGKISFASERAAALTRQLLAFSRKQVLQPRIVDLNEIVENFAPMFQRLIPENITVELSYAERPVRLRADPHQLEQVLLNLVVNARDAMSDGGSLCIEVAELDPGRQAPPPGLALAAGRHAVLSVTDSGNGIAPEIQARIFEPFYTTKAVGQGTGLGLATVAGIVDQAGGEVWLHSEVGRGTVFKVYLPTTDEPVERPAAANPERTNHEGGTVLLVEDEPHLRAVVGEVLVRAGYRVLAAATPVEALGIARHAEGDIDLLLTDLVMPQMSGIQLASEVLELRPGIPVLFTSGYTEDSLVLQQILDDQNAFLPKPLHAQSVVEKVGSLLSLRRSGVARGSV